MSLDPILLIGGSGHVGRHTARHLRAAHPDVPILIGGRDLVRARAVAAEVGGAKAVVVDLSTGDLGLGSRPVGAVATLFTDTRIAGLRFAQDHGVPYVSPSPGTFEIAPEVAAYMHRPGASAVVLGTEWLVGAASVPTLELAKTFARLDGIAIGALVDEEDDFGPESEVDLERQTRSLPAALVRVDGPYLWQAGEGAARTFRAVDGTAMSASALSINHVVGLAAATGAPNVRLDLATGTSSSRRRGEPLSTEILIELAGEDRAGNTRRTRHAVIHPEGQMPLTGFGLAMVLERLVGLDGGRPASPGLYFPHQRLPPDRYLPRLERTGAAVLDLEVK